ncbi:MAG: hypothetical protein IT342_15790 [Candidatus Melainabacteria bacterium]|nr:hypothetical protein [Candidatus Melainabacteria bacterium]
MKSEVQIELPDRPLTSADVVGRAVRITRLNWLQLTLFFVGPILVYELSTTCIWWNPARYGSNVPASVSFWIVALGIVFNGLSIWELAIRRLALVLFLFGTAPNLVQALAKARTKTVLVLILSIPLFFAELVMNTISYATSKITEAAGSASLHDPLMVVGAWLTAAELLLILPFLAIMILNIFFVTILVYEELTIMKTGRRFCELFFQDFRYIALFMTLISCVFFTSIALAGIVLPIEILMPPSAFKFLALSMATTVILTPVDTFLEATATVGGALLYKQVTARLEGRDLLERLKVLDSK